MAARNEHVELQIDPPEHQNLENICEVSIDPPEHQNLENICEVSTDPPTTEKTADEQEKRSPAEEKHDSPPGKCTTHENCEHCSEEESCPSVSFELTKDWELLMDDTDRVASASLVLRTMFQGPLAHDVLKGGISPWDYEEKLGYIEKTTLVQLNESNVWDVLVATHKHKLTPLVRLCFHFLLHHHARRHDGDHLCAALETAHGLRRKKQYKECLAQVLQHGEKVFSDPSTASKLSHRCLLDVVKADGLQVTDEETVYRAVVRWAQSRCGPDASREKLRKAAGDLVRHVRYLTLPQHTLTRLLKGSLSVEGVSSSSSSSSSAAAAAALLDTQSVRLLSEKEAENLLYKAGSRFPSTVRQQRTRGVAEKKRRKESLLKRHYLLWLSLISLIFLITILLQYCLTGIMLPVILPEAQTTTVPPKVTDPPSMSI